MDNQGAAIPPVDVALMGRISDLSACQRERRAASSMPGWLQAWSKVNPVTILSDAIRGLLVSGPVATPALPSLLWALGFTVVFAPLAVRAFKRRA